MMFVGAIACSPPPAMMDVAAQDAAETGPQVDVRTIADVGGCQDISGAYEWSGVCNPQMLGFSPNTCVTQTGCSARSTGFGMTAMTGMVSGNRLVETGTLPGGGTRTCTYVFEGPSATFRCVSTNPALDCDGTGERVSFMGATSYCCDVGQPNCGAGQRCSVIEGTAASNRFTACIPAGMIAEGAVCTREGGILGRDQCAAGLSCANLGQPTVEQRTCQRVCSANAQCRANEFCWSFGDTPPQGFCRPTCAIQGMSCSMGLSCRPALALGTNGTDLRVSSGCWRDGAGGEDAVCMYSDGCLPNFECTNYVGGNGVCRRTCDPTHPCPAGRTCTPSFVGAMNPSAIGTCSPM